MAARGLLLAAAALAPARAKVVTGEARLTGEFTEHDVVKFAFRVGRGSAALTVWTEEGDDYASDELKAYAYLDDDWDKVLRATTCDEKVKLARWSAPVDLRKDNALDAEWAPWRPPASSKFWAHRRAMTSSIRTHGWYFTLGDCSLERYLHPVPAVHYRAEMRDGDSHLPVDENGLRPLHFFNMVTAFILVYAVGKRIALAAAGRAKKGDGVSIWDVKAKLGVISTKFHMECVLPHARALTAARTDPRPPCLQVRRVRGRGGGAEGGGRNQKVVDHYHNNINTRCGQ